ncbi:hypothetical protein Tco_0895915 [Tanacetum coccineum]|uniref:Uncharacterized protein n=1 Tax=Tanacetum coccineum TaxID=301880 RepID=A0ABQ5CJ59_9ASTR
MILTTNTPYPSRKIRRIRAYTHQRPQRKLNTPYPEEVNTPYGRYSMDSAKITRKRSKPDKHGHGNG